jgi:ribosomal 50S subunit-associated protein YjgA (DUF615 family)
MADDDRSARQIARGKQRRAGDKSARLANALMKLGPAAAKRLEVDDDLRESIDRARAVTSLIARRRAERTLAGDLRRFDLAELEQQLAALDENTVDVRQFHLAEKWRARLIDDDAALAEFPGADAELTRLVAAARQERATGRPPGAARALFRHVAEALKHAAPADEP